MGLRVCSGQDPRRQSGKAADCHKRYTRECLAIRADRHIRSSDVIETLTEVMVVRGVPQHIRSDNGPEFTTGAIREWLGQVGAKTLYIDPGSRWENGYVESFNGKLRDELLDRRDLLHITRGAGSHRAVQTDLQSHQATQLIGLQASRTGGYSGESTADQREHCAHERGCTNIRNGTTIGGRS